MTRTTRLYKSPGVGVRLSLPIQAQAASGMALEIVDLLAPAVRPLSLDFAMACSIEDSGIIDDAILPDDGFFQIRETPPPEGVGYLPQHIAENDTLLPELTSAAIRTWYDDSARHACCDGACLPVFGRLSCLYAAARYLSDSELRVEDDRFRTWPVPILNRDGAVWAPGPLSVRPMDAPVSFAVANLGGRLQLEVSVGWALWAEAGVPEHEHLRQTLAAFVKRGWREETTRTGFRIE